MLSNEYFNWVISNAADTQYRYWNPWQGPAWTPNIDDALWFARRADAEQFAAEDEDAWHLRTVAEARAIKGPAPAPQGGTGGDAPDRGSDDAQGGVTPPPAALPAVDRASNDDVLRIFRQFVMLNATQWAMGAGDHHHPIWEWVAGHIDSQENTSGPDWAFIQPRNRVRHSELVAQEVIDHGN